MSTQTYLITLAMFFGAILLVFTMKYVSAAYQARARLVHDEAHRVLAERAVAVQAANQASLAGIESRVAAMAVSLASVETILKQVG